MVSVRVRLFVNEEIIVFDAADTFTWDSDGDLSLLRTRKDGGLETVAAVARGMWVYAREE